MNENKGIDNSWIKIIKCIGAKAQDEKMHWNTTKTNNGLTFNFQNSQLLIDLVFTDRRNLSGTWPESACGKSSSCLFSFSAVRNAITKATEYITFCFSFRISLFFPF